MDNCCENTGEAAKNNHLEYLKRMRECEPHNRRPWHICTTSEASSNGHLEILKYVREHNPDDRCPWHPSATYWAALNGHLDCLKYMIENDEPCPLNPSSVSACVFTDRLECLEYIYENCHLTWDESELEGKEIGVFSNDCVKFIEEIKEDWKKWTEFLWKKCQTCFLK